MLVDMERDGEGEMMLAKCGQLDEEFLGVRGGCVARTRVESTLPNRQFSFALSFVDFGRNDITCESEISHFARMVVRDEDVAGRKVSVDYLRVGGDRDIGELFQCTGRFGYVEHIVK